MNPRQRGSASFALLVILPAALLAAAALIDISGWYLFREELLLRLDVAALAAARHLPNQQRTKAAIEQLLNDSPLTTVNVEEEEGGITVTGAFRYKAPLSSFLAGRDQVFRVVATSGVEPAPVDYILVLPDGKSLRPGWRSAGTRIEIEAPWGDPVEWGAHPLLSCLGPPQRYISHASFPWWEAWSDPNFQRWVTQGCANPVLTPLKRAAVAAVREISASSTNRMGLFFTPGNTDSGVTVIRPLVGLTSPFLDGGRPEARWLPTISNDLSISDEICALIQPAAENSDASSCSPIITPPRCGNPYSAIGVINDCYLHSNYSLTDAINWRAIRNDSVSPSVPDIVATIRRSIEHFSEQSSPPLDSQLQRRRHSSLNQPRQQIVLLTDYLPETDALSPILLSLKDRSISFAAITFAHRGLSSAAALQLNQRAEVLRALGYRVITTPSAEEVEPLLLDELLISGRRYVLKR